MKTETKGKKKFFPDVFVFVSKPPHISYIYPIPGEQEKGGSPAALAGYEKKNRKLRLKPGPTVGKKTPPARFSGGLPK